MITRSFFIFVFAFSLIASALEVSAEKARVKRVVDGDTFVKADGTRVRMTGINAPERDAPFGSESTQYLRKLIEGKTVDLEKDRYSSNTDKYQRELRRVYLDGRDINLQMVENGYAWAFTRYKFSDSKQFKAAERQAEAEGIGLWPTYKNGAEQSQQKSDQELEINKILKAIAIIILLIVGYFFRKKGRRR